MSWEQQLLQIASKGSTTERGGGLKALAARRKLTQSQYFTPEWLVKLIWSALAPITTDGRYSILDNSMGSGRFFAGANPDNHLLMGLDTDKEKVELVSEILKSQDFSVDFAAVGMESVKLPEVSAALINPPFSITLSSPDMKAMPGITNYGNYGPNTNALSHEFALQQALDAADVVFAVLPNSQVQTLDKYKGYDRLCAIFSLPSDTFEAEGVKAVNTSLCVFTKGNSDSCFHGALSKNSTALPRLPLKCRPINELSHGFIVTKGIENQSPKITKPVTGDKRVRLYAKGERIGIRFYCGLTQAKVMNQLIGHKLYSQHGHRYPKEATHRGLSKFLMQAHLFGDDPISSVHQHFTDALSKQGYEVILDPQLCYRLRKLHRKEQVAQTPYGKWVYQVGPTTANYEAKDTDMLDADDMMSPFVEEGECYTLSRVNEGYNVSVDGKETAITVDRAHELFKIDNDLSDGDWIELHEPLTNEFPNAAATVRAQAKKAGIDNWLSWDFQFDDLIEMLVKGSGANAYQMGLGKTRFATALAMMGGERNLIVVKSRLFDEFKEQLEALPIDKADIGYIKSFSDIENLNRITLTTVSALKSTRLLPRWKKRTQTLGEALKHKVNTLVVDEGSILCNRLSDQSKAIMAIKPKHQYVLDGEIIHGYARKTLPIITSVAGECRVSQPFSIADRPYLLPGTVNGFKNAVTGLKAYTDKHVTLEWATNEFRDSLEEGAKREVPKISNIPEFRDWIDPWVKRRVHGEPQVVKHVQIQPPKINKPTTVEWDERHLGVFLDVAESYRRWFIEHERQRGQEGKGINLAAVLQQIQAVDNATNAPEYIGKAYAGAYSADTSKMTAAVELAVSQIKQGKRPVIFASSPRALKRMKRQLEAYQVAVCYVDGTVSMKKRTQELNKLRSGEYQVGCLSLGTMNDGVNLPQITNIIFYDRSSWEARVENQAIYRACRPETTHQVEVDYFELPGSLDTYQDMVIDWKKVSAVAGMDYGEEPPTEENFYHLEHFVREFVESVPGLQKRLEKYKLGVAA